MSIIMNEYRYFNDLLEIAECNPMDFLDTNQQSNLRRLRHEVLVDLCKDRPITTSVYNLEDFYRGIPKSPAEKTRLWIEDVLSSDVVKLRAVAQRFKLKPPRASALIP